MWRYTAGLNPDENRPGYKHFFVKPHPVPEVDSCNARYESVRGPIDIVWKQLATEFVLDVKIPPGSSATVYIPASDINKIEESGQPCHLASGVRFVEQQGETTVLLVQSGTYKFSSKN